MNFTKPFIFLLFLCGCHYEVKVTKPYHQYFDDETYQTLVKGTDAYSSGKYLLADTLLTAVIDKSKNKLSLGMPKRFNPYFYRGHTYLELDKYAEAIKDFELVASNTTTDTMILLARTEAYKMLGQYDTAISINNRLLALQFDSALVLAERGICYFQKGEMENACADFRKAKRLATRDMSFYDKFLKDCK